MPTSRFKRSIDETGVLRTTTSTGFEKIHSLPTSVTFVVTLRQIGVRVDEVVEPARSDTGRPP